MNKNIRTIAVVLVVVLIIAYVFGVGFHKEPTAFISEYELSSNQKQMTVHVDLASSTGYVRKATTKVEDDGTLVITFYSAFGGFNGSIGAKDEFTINLGDNVNKIAIYRDSSRTEVVLQKDSNGNWYR